jgi:predicted nucleic acid-binding protein
MRREEPVHHSRALGAWLVTRYTDVLAGLVDTETVSRAWVDTLHVARTRALSSYDASYLELALRRGVPLATLDRKLKEAAVAAGVSLYQPLADRVMPRHAR